MTNEETLSDWLRQQCGHDSRSVDECTNETSMRLLQEG